ncbi:hypothetical protein ACHAQJ_005843 [Trichoderma viride]
MDCLPGAYAVFEIEAIFGDEIKHKHFALYVEIDERASIGQLFHVRSAVREEGMIFERQYYMGPGIESLATFKYKSQIGLVNRCDLDRMAEVCSGFGTPPVQFVDRECQCWTWVQQVAYCLQLQEILI